MCSSKMKQDNPFKIQRNFKYYKHILGVGFVREMFGGSRQLAGILRSKSPKLSLFKNLRHVRYHKQNLGVVARGKKCKLSAGWN